MNQQIIKFNKLNEQAAKRQAELEQAKGRLAACIDSITDLGCTPTTLPREIQRAEKQLVDQEEELADVVNQLTDVLASG